MTKQTKFIYTLIAIAVFFGMLGQILPSRALGFATGIVGIYLAFLAIFITVLQGFLDAREKDEASESEQDSECDCEYRTTRRGELGK